MTSVFCGASLFFENEGDLLYWPRAVPARRRCSMSPLFALQSRPLATWILINGFARASRQKYYKPSASALLESLHFFFIPVTPVSSLNSTVPKVSVTCSIASSNWTMVFGNETKACFLRPPRLDLFFLFSAASLSLSRNMVTLVTPQFCRSIQDNNQNLLGRNQPFFQINQFS